LVVQEHIAKTILQMCAGMQTGLKDLNEPFLIPGLLRSAAS